MTRRAYRAALEGGLYTLALSILARIELRDRAIVRVCQGTVGLCALALLTLITEVLP